MANVPESMLRLKPIDTWSTREKLALATYAQKNNDQNFSSSKGLKAFAETPRPDDWFSRRMCALQYREMIDVFEKDQKDVPKRKRRDKGTKETSLDIIVKNLTDQRRTELQDSIPKLIYEQCRLQAKLDKLKDPTNRKEFLEEAKKYIREKKKAKEEGEVEHDKWLIEREAKINNMFKTPMVARQPTTPRVLVKQEAIDLEMKPLQEQASHSVETLPQPSQSSTSTHTHSTTPATSTTPTLPPSSSPIFKDAKETLSDEEEMEEIEKESQSEPEVIEISETAPSETVKSESDDKTETSEDIQMEDSKNMEPESPVSQSDVNDEMPEVKEVSKVPKTPPAVTVQNRPTRSHSKTISESHSKDIIIEDDDQSQASTVDSSIPEESIDSSRPSRDSEKEHKESKFNKRSAIKVLNALQTHRFAPLISSPVAMKLGKEMLVKKLDIPQIKRKIENDQINTNEEFSRNLSLIFLAALYSNNIDWSSPDYSKITKMRHEIMDMLAGEEKGGSGHRSKRI